MSSLAASLAARAARGTHAMLATRVLAILVAFASITVYARLISPADYGVWAMASLALGFATILRELGLTSSIVQARELTGPQRDTFFWTSIAVTLAAALALALAAPLLARLYGTPLLQPVLWASCIALLLTGGALVHTALLRRELEFRKLALVEAGGVVCGLATGLTAAWLWRDVWALVAGHIAAAAWMAGSAWLLGRWLPRRPSLRPASVDHAFSFQLAGFNFLNYAANNVCLIAGFRFGAASLGFFNRAQQLYSVAFFPFLAPITEVGFSLLCRLNGDAHAYRAAYIALARRVAVVFIPYAVALAILSQDVIRALLGEPWAPAAPILAWLAPAVLGER
jgi:PST family polysaccharide transporter